MLTLESQSEASDPSVSSAGNSGCNLLSASITGFSLPSLSPSSASSSEEESRTRVGEGHLLGSLDSWLGEEEGGRSRGGGEGGN